MPSHTLKHTAQASDQYWRFWVLRVLLPLVGPVAQRLEQPRKLSGLVTGGLLCLIRGEFHGPVAQRLEQGTHNPLVPGSNPGGPSLRFGAQRQNEGCHAVTK
ncbi:MAG: hypothetical protein QOE81_1560 [Verrucomicrobiota bacterium]